MNNVTHATDSKRTFVWEIYNYYSELGEPAYRIKMSRLLWGCELYMVRKVSDTRWIGLVKRVSLRRRIKIVLDSVDIQVIERALGRKLADKEYFADGQEVDLTCHHYEGLTLHGVLSANIGRGMAYRADVVSIALPTKLQRMQWILDTLRQRRDLCQVHDLITSIKIECKDSHRGTIETLIAAYSDGIDIVWKTYSVKSFTGLIAAVELKEVSGL